LTETLSQSASKDEWSRVGAVSPAAVMIYCRLKLRAL